MESNRSVASWLCLVLALSGARAVATGTHSMVFNMMGLIPAVPGGRELRGNQINEEIVQIGGYTETKDERGRVVRKGYMAWCSSTLIGRTTVLTAAHCVNESNDMGAWLVTRDGRRKFVKMKCESDDKFTIFVRQERPLVRRLERAMTALVKNDKSTAVMELEQFIEAVGRRDPRARMRRKNHHTRLAPILQAIKQDGADLKAIATGQLHPIWEEAVQDTERPDPEEAAHDLALCRLDEPILDNMKTACLPPKGDPYKVGENNDRLIGFGCRTISNGDLDYPRDPAWNGDGATYPNYGPKFQGEGTVNLYSVQTGVILGKWKQGDANQASACAGDSGGFLGFRKTAAGPLRVTGVLSDGESHVTRFNSTTGDFYEEFVAESDRGLLASSVVEGEGRDWLDRRIAGANPPYEINVCPAYSLPEVPPPPSVATNTDGPAPEPSAPSRPDGTPPGAVPATPPRTEPPQGFDKIVNGNARTTRVSRWTGDPRNPYQWFDVPEGAIGYRYENGWPVFAMADGTTRSTRPTGTSTGDAVVTSPTTPGFSPPGTQPTQPSFQPESTFVFQTPYGTVVAPSGAAYYWPDGHGNITFQFPDGRLVKSPLYHYAYASPATVFPPVRRFGGRAPSGFAFRPFRGGWGRGGFSRPGFFGRRW